MEKPYEQMDDIWGFLTPYFRKHPYTSTKPALQSFFF